jgi:hypothetical protein
MPGITPNLCCEGMTRADEGLGAVGAVDAAAAGETEGRKAVAARRRRETERLRVRAREGRRGRRNVCTTGPGRRREEARGRRGQRVVRVGRRCRRHDRLRVPACTRHLMVSVAIEGPIAESGRRLIGPVLGRRRETFGASIDSRRAHAEGILAVREANPAVLDQSVERMTIVVVQSLRGIMNVIELANKLVNSNKISFAACIPPQSTSGRCSSA